MHILLCNDDGYKALGIQTLAKTLEESGHTVTVVAPHAEQSGQSHSMSFFRPVLVEKRGLRTYSVHGTPADCAFVALHSLLKEDPPDLVISGINHGLNVGWDVNYSGTVGAATEATLLGYRAIAISVDIPFGAPVGDEYLEAFQRAALFARDLVEKVETLTWPRLEVLNVNHPGVEPKGTKVADCSGTSMFIPGYDELAGKTSRSENMRVYLIGGAKRRPIEDGSEDVSLIQAGYVTLSFLQCRQSSTANNVSLKTLTSALNETCK